MSCRIEGSDLIELSGVTMSSFDQFFDMCACEENVVKMGILSKAVSHLRDKIDVKNRSQFIGYNGKIRSRSLCKLVRDIWYMPLHEIEVAIEQRLGLFGASYCEIILACSNELRSLAKEFKSRLSHLRAMNDAEEQKAAFAAVTSCNDPSPLDRLVYLALGRVKADVQARAVGVAGEYRVEEQLRQIGVEFWTESQQRVIQTQLFLRVVFPTPDVIFRRPQHIGDATGVRWLDVKNTLVIPGCTLDARTAHFNTQMHKYSKIFGSGAIVWLRGYVATLRKPMQVKFLQLDHQDKRQDSDAACTSFHIGQIPTQSDASVHVLGNPWQFQ